MGIVYTKVEHKKVYTIDEMASIGFKNTEAIAKNLFIRDDKKQNYYLVTISGEKRIDLKEFAARFATRKLSFASEDDLYNILGLTKGSVTPFGLLNDKEHKVTFCIDRCFEHKSIAIHPNENTATVWILTADLLSLLQKTGCKIRWID